MAAQPKASCAACSRLAVFTLLVPISGAATGAASWCWRFDQSDPDSHTCVASSSADVSCLRKRGSSTFLTAATRLSLFHCSKTSSPAFCPTNVSIGYHFRDDFRLRFVLFRLYRFHRLVSVLLRCGVFLVGQSCTLKAGTEPGSLTQRTRDLHGRRTNSNLRTTTTTNVSLLSKPQILQRSKQPTTLSTHFIFLLGQHTCRRSDYLSLRPPSLRPPHVDLDDCLPRHSPHESLSIYNR